MIDYIPPIDKVSVDPSDAATIPKFVDPLPIPEIALADNWANEGDIFYHIVMKESKHKFHKYFPPTKIWGYNGTYPGPTFEVNKDVPIKVRWANRLPKKHFLPLDRTLHGSMNAPEVRTVVHLHGANVAAHSDGHPEAWYTKDYAFKGQAFSREVYEYTNHQPGATLWYHDHAIGITRLNVYSGLVGLYIIRDQLEERLNLPKDDYEIPLLIQDKSFNRDGSLFYPDNATPPVTSPTPSAPTFFFGDTVVVNGKVWPYLNVEPRKYRFRILNASNNRAYNLRLDNGGAFHQIGTDLGLLHHSIPLDSFILEPAERIDLIIDFSKYQGEEIILENTAGGPSGPETNVIMKFKVCLDLSSKDRSTIPHELFPYHQVDPQLAVRQRTMVLDQKQDHRYPERTMHQLNDRMWSDPVTEKVGMDTIEIWHLVNRFAFPHPIHVHLVNFQILGRKEINPEDFDSDGNYIFDPKTDMDNLTKPLEFERGLKDVVRTEPNQVTSILMHFKDYAGDYVWHCHILEHEDNDMMRPLKVVE